MLHMYRHCHITRDDIADGMGSRVTDMGSVSHLRSRSHGAPATSDPVLRAAYDGVLEIGLGRLTLAEVARRAGVSRMTVYRRYDDLDRLISALLVVEFGAVIAEAAERARGAATGRGVWSARSSSSPGAPPSTPSCVGSSSWTRRCSCRWWSTGSAAPTGSRWTASANSSLLGRADGSIAPPATSRRWRCRS